MRVFDLSFLASIVLLCFPLADGAKSLSLLRGGDRSLQSSSEVVRTDLIRLIPFQVQMALQDETNGAGSEAIAETLYEGGTLLTDTITDWMVASFLTKTDNEQAEQLIQNNYTSFDSIALELRDNQTSTGTIDGQELNLVQISYEGVTLWERIGTGTPPMEPEIVELIQRATFLEDRSLKVSLQSAINNLLFNLGIDSVDGVPPLTIVDVRAYIAPSSSFVDEDDDEEEDAFKESGDVEGDETTEGAEVPTRNKKLETIIIVAIVVACLAFALLVFAVVWAWRSDRRERDNGKASSSKSKKSKKPRVAKEYPETKPKKKEGKPSAPQKSTTKGAYQQAPAESSIEAGSSYDLPQVDSGDGSYPKVIGRSGNDSSAYPGDSVVSEDISSSLTAYYKSGMGYSGSKASTAGSREPRNFNDAASLSSMDSYGYSLDGYAPSLGPTQGGYPVGPMQAARDAPMPMGDTDIKQLQDDESIDDYSAEPATK